MTRTKTTQRRISSALSLPEIELLNRLIVEDSIAEGRHATIMGRLLVEVFKCRDTHGRKPQGRPKKQEAEPELDIPEDNLSFSDEEIAKLKK